MFRFQIYCTISDWSFKSKSSLQGALAQNAELVPLSAEEMQAAQQNMASMTADCTVSQAPVEQSMVSEGIMVPLVQYHSSDWTVPPKLLKDHAPDDQPEALMGSLLRPRPYYKAADFCKSELT